MDFSQRLEISYYKTIATINEAHNVFLVQHQETNKICVKKILDVYNISIYEYLKKHYITGTPRIIDYCEENNQLILIEEYIQGKSLQEKMESGELTSSALKKYVCELCDILERLHSLSPAIVHRDIKPSNILINQSNQVILVDFNASKYLTNRETEDTVLLGTKGYAAPEQYGFGSSTPQTDIYALGILMKEATAVLKPNMHDLDAIINKCTEIDPKNRYKNVSAIKSAVMKTDRHLDVTPKKETPKGWHAFLPPGFRTATPWKMLIAVSCYVFIFWLCLFLEVEGEMGFLLWVNRICCLIIMLFVVFSACNYLNVQKLMPLCKSSNPIIKYIGVFLLDSIVVSILLTFLIILETVYKN